MTRTAMEGYEMSIIEVTNLDAAYVFGHYQGHFNQLYDDRAAEAGGIWFPQIPLMIVTDWNRVTGVATSRTVPL